MDTVASELNRLYSVFRKRNPNFSGRVSVAGHSLGSVILLDLLMHQRQVKKQNGDEASKSEEPTSGSSGDPAAGNGVEDLVQKGVGSVLTASAIRARRSQSDETILSNDQTDVDTSRHHQKTSSVDFEIGTAGTGQPSIVYPQLAFEPQCAFLLGSPIAMFLTVRGLTQLSPQYRLPTCPHVFNIFHPYDPVAYRLETLIHPHLTDLRPVLVPHHKGRKRMHLELKDTLERVGSDIKQKIVDSISTTWNKLYHLYTGAPSEEQMEQAVEEQLGKLGVNSQIDSGVGRASDEDLTNNENVMIGNLNGGRRIDYVLQEKPYESFTEYIFALQAHLSYWKSEDTLLMMLKEIYRFMDVQADTEMSSAVSSGISSNGNQQSSSIPMSPTMAGSGGNSHLSSPTEAAALPPLLPSNSFTTPIPMMPPSTISAPPIPTLPVTPGQAATAQQPGIPLMAPPPSGPPSFPPNISGMSGFPAGAGSVMPPKVIGGRPVMDVSAIPQRMGMDPTVEPQVGAAVPPPPTSATFTRKKLVRK